MMMRQDHLGKLFFIFIGVFLSLLVGYICINKPVKAVSGGEWQAGNIVPDSSFYDGGSMSVSQIQAFLQSKVPNCDTYGTQPASEYDRSDITHAQYAAQNSWPVAPYYCLTTYRQVPRDDAVVNSFNTSAAELDRQGALSAAQIIYNAATLYNISPKALIVTLQKESPGPLVTDTWPFASQYRNAMGYACPDGAPCDAKYEGFYRQVMNMAWQYKHYKENPSLFRHIPFQNNSVSYSPSGACGSSSVYIQNYATAGLYNYTPYQPNAAALANLYGEGDGCSAYGNRNFWRLLHDWFPSAYGFGYNFDVTQSLYLSNLNPLEGENVTAIYKVKNTSSSTYTISLTISDYASDVRGWNSFPYQTATLAPGGEYTYQATRPAKYAGRHQLELAIGYNGGAYSLGSTTGKLVRFNYDTRAFNPRSVTLTKSMWLSNINPLIGDTVSGFYEVKNTNSSPITVDLALVDYAVDAKGWNSYPYKRVTIGANTTAQFKGSHVSRYAGAHYTWLAYVYGGGAYNFSSNGQLADFWYNARAIDSNALTVTKSMWLSSTNPVVGADVSGFYEVKNNTESSLTIDLALVDYAVDAKGWNSYPYKRVTILPGGTAQFTGARAEKYQGIHHAWLAFVYNGNAYNFTSNDGRLVDFWYSAR